MAVLAYDGADHGAQLGGVLAAPAPADKVPAPPVEFNYRSVFSGRIIQGDTGTLRRSFVDSNLVIPPLRTNSLCRFRLPKQATEQSKKVNENLSQDPNVTLYVST